MNKRPHCILHVDDSEDDIAIVQYIFTEIQFTPEVQVAQDGEEALSILRKQAPHETAPTPDLVLLDIRMPRKDGLEVLREMKGDPALRHIPVIMLTTSNREEDVAASYSSGACSYITKQLNLDKYSDNMRTFSS